MKKSRSGFTIVEILVVIVIIAILAAIVIVSYNGIQARNRDAQRKTDIANIIKALELYYADNGEYPLSTVATGSSINDNWYSSNDGSWQMLRNKLETGKYIDRLPSDPVNTPSTSMISTSSYGYALYVNKTTYCGLSNGHMYVLVYKFEASKREQNHDGECGINPLSYGGALSYYRSSKAGS